MPGNEALPLMTINWALFLRGFDFRTKINITFSRGQKTILSFVNNIPVIFLKYWASKLESVKIHQKYK